VGAPLRVRVLGGLVVEGFTEHDLGSRKGRLLLKVLVLARGRPVSVDRLADAVWADGDLPAKPAEQVGVLVSRLRRVLGQDRVVRTDAGYALVADWLDLDDLAARVDEASAALGDGRVAAARMAASAALALARGEVLPGDDGEWVEADRSAAAALVGSARRVAAEAAARAGDVNAAGALAEQALAHDPHDEAALRLLMRAHVAAGRPASALSAYVRVRERMAEDLGVPPSPETEALHDRIVLGDTGRLVESTRATAASPSTIVGRTAELGVLDDALAGVVSTGGSATVLVDGEPGIGKSALIRAWAASLGGRDDVLVLVGRCDELGHDLPLQPLADAVVAALGELSESEHADVVGDDVAGAVLGVAGGDVSRDATVVVDAAAGRARLFAALAGVIARLARGRTVVLVLDDAHLAADSTRAWLAFATRRLSSVLVVAASRRREPPAIAADVTVTLAPLDVDALAGLVGDERAPALLARTGGLPLLVTALLASEDDDGDAAAPATVADAVERRVAALGTDAATTVRSAAVLGTRVDLDLLADVIGAPAVDLLAHLEAAAGGGVLVEDGGLRFRHELERVALVGSVGATRRSLLHRRAAHALAARPSPDPLAVALHARDGGDEAVAARWFVTAAEASAARFDVDTAERHLAAALALGPSLDALVVRARLRLGALRLDDAAADAAHAVALSGDARALEIAGWVAYYRRRYDDAMAYADGALDRAMSDPALRVSCLALAGRVQHGLGRLPAAIERLEMAIGLDAPPEVRGIAAVWLAFARAHEGRPEESLVIGGRALVDADRLVHPFAALHGRFARVMALGQLGRVAEALEACDELDAGLERAAAAGARFIGPAANCRAWLLRWTGRFTEADALNEKGVDTSEPAGPRAEAYYAGLLDLVDGRLLADDLDGAAAVLERLAPIDEWRGTMAWHQRHRWRLARARLALAVGDRDAAAALAVDVHADAASRGARRYAWFAEGVAAIATRSGDPARLDAVVQGLSSCARLDGWPLIDALSDTFDVPAWRRVAVELASSVVDAAPDRDAARAFVDAAFGT
jgi:DNA-binding SARP family transcriptional activator